MIRRLNKHSDLKDLIKSCPSGVIDDIYAIEYYIQGYNTVIQANFTKKGSLLEVILPSSDLETLPNGILMRRAYYKVLDASYPDGYYNLEFEDNLNVWLGEVESEEPVIPEYITEEELAETLEDYATTEDVTTAVSDLGGRIDDLSSSVATSISSINLKDAQQDDTLRLVGEALTSADTRISALENAGYITSAALSGYATEQWVGSQGYLTSASLSDYATKSYVDDAISDIPVPENVVQYDVDHPLIEDFGLNMDVLKRGEFEYGDDIQTKGLVLGYEEYKEDDVIKQINTIEIRDGQLARVQYQNWDEYYEYREYFTTETWVSQQGYITSSALSSALSGYATEQWVYSKDFATESWVLAQGYLTSHQDLSSYATMLWVENQGYLTSHQDLSSYATMLWVEAQDYASKLWVMENIPSLTGYATTSYVDSQVSGVKDWVGSQSYLTSTSLSNYITESTIENLGFATESWVQSQGYLTSHQDLSSYATKSWVSSQQFATKSWVSAQGYLTSHQDLTGYATESWVQSQGYLTSHQDLSSYATMSWVSSQSYLTSVTVSNYITESVIENLGFATESWVLSQGYITASTIPSDIATQSWVSSQQFATESWVSSQGYLTSHQDLTGYATESWVQSQGYLTSHQDLTGYATESWVSAQGYLTSHQDLSSYATKSWVSTNYIGEDEMWTGTRAQWETLTSEQQASYKIALITA